MRVKADVDSQIRCPACGSSRARSAARYCLDCGKLLAEDYQPLDTLRAAYRLQGKSFLFKPSADIVHGNLFAESKNTIAETAWACVVYSMVPYLGVLFIPFAMVTGSIGFAAAIRSPQLGGKRLSLVSIGMSFGILGIQLVLWWLLYIIPDLGHGI